MEFDSVFAVLERNTQAYCMTGFLGFVGIVMQEMLRKLKLKKAAGNE